MTTRPRRALRPIVAALLVSVFCGGLVFSGSGAASAKGDSPLANGGFEDGTKGWMVVDNSGQLESGLDKKEKAEGKQSLHLHKKSAGAFDTIRADLAGVPAKTKVTVTAKFKADGISNGWFKIFFYDEHGETIEQGADVKSIKGTYDWKSIKISNKSPKSTASAAIFVLLVSPGKLWIDDVEVEGRGIGGKAKKPAKPKPLAPKLKAWLNRNAVKVRTLDFDASLRDLAPLKKILADVRIVQLGEQSHGDGESFRAKARLVRFLHQEMGFDVLAFESGLYECEMANALFAEGKVAEGTAASVFGIWHTTQTKPVYEYLAKHANDERPLRLTGFDTRGSGRLASDVVPKLQELLAPLGKLSDDEAAALGKINELLDGHPYEPDEADHKKARSALEKLRKIFDAGRAKLVEKHGERTTAFLSRCLDNYVVREVFEHSKSEDDENAPGIMRDKQMAENLRWLADVYYPDKKIITWAATSHQAHNLTKVEISGDSSTYEEWKNMGQYVHDWYGEQVYTIGFAAHEGSAGRFKHMFDLDPPRPDSLEDVFHRFGPPLLFVDLRRDNPFGEPRYCSPMAYGRNMRAPWPEVLDAIFYVQEMTPTTFER